MYAEALVAIYRFLPFEDTLPLFASCFEPERSEAVKICAVRACLTLIQEVDSVAAFFAELGLTSAVKG